MGTGNDLARTLGIPLFAGRDFTEQDKLDSPLVVILSNSTVKKLFPNENPIGRQILFGTENGNCFRSRSFASPKTRMIREGSLNGRPRRKRS